MNSIGFKNFRRFQEFPEMSYGPITFLVGKNNSGKSTVVKALLLIYEYLQSGDYNKFSFGNNVLESANIVTFDRAKNRNAKTDEIEFSHTYFGYHIKLKVSGNEGDTYANVHYFSIRDIEAGFEFVIEPQKKDLSISIINVAVDIDESDATDTITALKQEIEDLEKSIEGIEFSLQNVIVAAKINELKDKLKQYRANIKKEKNDVTEIFTSHYESVNSFDKLFKGFILEKKNEYSKQYEEVQRGKKVGKSKEFAGLTKFKEKQNEIEKSISYIYDVILNANNKKFHYIPASSTKQYALLNIRDKQNSLAQAVHQFAMLRLSPGQRDYEFVLKWMKEFEVGEMFKITLQAGEAYEVTITSNGTTTPLADFGMGSIQVMMLLFTFAALQHKYDKELDLSAVRKYGITESDVAQRSMLTVFIEEPEINLHPALQSKLADLFYSLNFQLIVETHSEYIIRRTQVKHAKEIGIVAAPILDRFEVIYFPNNYAPYKMEYNDDGTFNKSFGEGFFDAASTSTLELIKLRREREN